MACSLPSPLPGHGEQPSSPAPLTLPTEYAKLREGRDRAQGPGRLKSSRTEGCSPASFSGLQALYFGSRRLKSEFQLCRMPAR